MLVTSRDFQTENLLFFVGCQWSVLVSTSPWSHKNTVKNRQTSLFHFASVSCVDFVPDFP